MADIVERYFLPSRGLQLPFAIQLFQYELAKDKSVVNI
jgi:hypothetical protein